MLKIKTNKQRVEDIMEALEGDIEYYRNLKDTQLELMDVTTNLEEQERHLERADKYLNILVALNSLKRYIDNNCL